MTETQRQEIRVLAQDILDDTKKLSVKAGYLTARLRVDDIDAKPLAEVIENELGNVWWLADFLIERLGEVKK